MKSLEFPLISLKTKETKKSYDINSPEGRRVYFNDKVGDEIQDLKDFLKEQTFITYLLGKKFSGKGTYSKMFTEIFGSSHVAHIAVGDVVRQTHANWDKFKKSKKYDLLKSYYRGYMSLNDAVEALLGRSTDKLLPTEFILALMKVYISDYEGKSLFIDGLPRQMDQVSYSLYFRDLINYRQDPDVFTLIDIPESVINERVKYRRVCPRCNTSRNLKLFITSKIEYDEKAKEYHLICDNPTCKGARMEPKEGDDLGIEPIRPRLDKDEEILRNIFDLHGVPKILLRNHVPVKEANKYYDKYEITPEFLLSQENGKVKVTQKPWSVKDDNGKEAYSLMAAPVMATMIKQLVDIFNL